MALSKSSLKGRIVSEFEKLGATSDGPHSWVSKMAEAIAAAVVDEIQSNGEAVISGGSSLGRHKIE